MLDRRGVGVDAMSEQVRTAVASYPYPNTYRPWSGQNSNTFLAHIARQVPELAIQLPSNAVGKNFLPGGGRFRYSSFSPRATAHPNIHLMQ